MLRHMANTQICAVTVSPSLRKNTQVTQNNVTSKIKFIAQEL